MTRRRLRPDELELWRKVTEKAERLDAGAAMKQALEVTRVDPPKPRVVPRFETLPKPAGAKGQPAITRDVLRPVAERLSNAQVQMDRKAFDQMRRGKLKPEARIDLHGMTLDHAHPALTRFILSSQASGRRLVLVITGKGKARDEGGPIPVRFGVLRHQVPQWLTMAPLSQAVLQITPANIRHGGTGAYYVYLRKRR
ncbi:Smr/MutS family protein [Pseudosulfitobacter pseudonitzschiae]|uniref:Smr/MutS family protein n=1 Tax=Pseudosulfitobacter pseudonitzschiae TaxID=1402135 RepID=UPI001AFAB1BE|nr:Smr/MutS family protein [Pseudosulfitobacter pseudonitzschiae]MBM1815631.1 Smr/MutS family protein [Pseudosulfitobacter pseudonitzschiae]MBM1832622.1 Smr/MutS family protein [Pseudosulfitobacter pseudonitzschiae]MBM1837490.1 Smr/MutS family protein [Pseudosulfitobacter pseudonitzschiae]MBM1842336.1 Smr/MutS family protein [Pseudosulfitobacter pseudonitzschiae]MBM1847204.1 Smr/MutS family protein [Pseudosulfitobacter pseudonitzschiae]